MHIIFLFILILVMIFGLYLIAICPDLSRKKRMEAFHGIMFAHRGLHYKRRGIPENSMAAFRKAIAAGYGIELDIHLTADQKLVVFHDDTLDRLCGRSERPEDLTARELTACHLYNTKETIPLFQDVLKLVDGRVPLLIELKVPQNASELCAHTYQALKSYQGAYLIQSFHPYALRWFYTHAPEVLRGQLSARLTKDTELKSSFFIKFFAENLLGNFYGKPDFISYKMNDLPLLSATLIRKFCGTTFAVWTLRSRAAIRLGKRHYEIQIFEDPVNFDD